VCEVIVQPPHYLHPELLVGYYVVLDAPMRHRSRQLKSLSRRDRNVDAALMNCGDLVGLEVALAERGRQHQAIKDVIAGIAEHLLDLASHAAV
jgi:hypothetical protein